MLIVSAVYIGEDLVFHPQGRTQIAFDDNDKNICIKTDEARSTWGQFHVEKLHDLCPSLNITIVLKSRRISIQNM
jgi:hypothetical protein